MMQPSLLFGGTAHIETRGPADARPRLSRQATQVLERLQRGPASNRELSAISLKYTGRISDLRANGYVVECLSHDYKTGEAWYRLQEQP
jgi:hypothetical protein